jgi:predicted dehydrogenase
VGLCDLIPERLETLGGELGVAARYNDLDRMIAAEAPDIVAIPTGTEFHYELALRVLEHGVHIDIEKPICTTLAEADQVLAKAEEQGVEVAVHHQGRTGGALRAVKAAIAAGKFGTLRYLQGSGKGYYGGYGLMNIATHMLNSMLAVAGPVRSVQAAALTDGRPIAPADVVPSPSGMGYIAGEQVTAALDFASGITASLLQHRFAKMDSTAYMMEIYGSEGRLYWKSGNPWFLPEPHFAPGKSEWQPLEPIVPDHFDAEGAASVEDYQFADEYVQALDEGRAHECSGTEGRHVLEILMGIFESGAYGRRVELPQTDRTHPLLRWRREAGLDLPAPMPRPYGEWLEVEDRRLGRS